MDFCLLLRVKMLVKIQVKTQAVNTVRNLLIKLNNLLQMHLKLLQKKAIWKRPEATGHLIGNKNTDRITKVSNVSPNYNSETNEK